MREVRFLVVDDSAIARSLVTAVIRTRLGADKIFQAADGRDALLLLEDTPVDIIISDWNMTQVNGDELLAYVRRHHRLKHIPFIMVSTNNQRDFIVNAQQLGVTQYLVKPFTPAELEQKIRNSWNAASKRKSERHAGLPQHQLSLKVDGCVYPGTVVNLSRSGALLRVKYGDAIGLYKQCELAMAFSDPASGRRWDISDLTGTTLRLEADGGEMCLVAVKFETEGVIPTMIAPLGELIDWLASRAPQVINI
jgi:CheY-like chemotaxis protein